MILPQLFDRDSSGNIKTWQISTNGPDIITTHGKLGFKQITNVKTITTGKNIGRSNETTPVEQAEAEARSTYQKKLDKGYVEELEDAESKPKELLPMLAHNYTKRRHDIVFPAYAQGKYNGCRMLAIKLNETEIKYISRMGKEFTTVNHLSQHLLGMMCVGQILDGEIYNHDWSFQRIVSAIKKQSEDSPLLQFWVYDTILAEQLDMTYERRLASLVTTFTKAGGTESIRMAPTKPLLCADHVQMIHNDYVADGYEGLIIRNAKGVYTFKHRSKDLQKFKMFEDNEYKIVGGKEGTGSDLGCVVFECVTKEKNTFSVRPKGSVAYRRELFQQLPSLVGQALTVRHQGYTDDGLPVFPVGLVIRDYE